MFLEIFWITFDHQLTLVKFNQKISSKTFNDLFIYVEIIYNDIEVSVNQRKINDKNKHHIDFCRASRVSDPNIFEILSAYKISVRTSLSLV